MLPDTLRSEIKPLLEAGDAPADGWQRAQEDCCQHIETSSVTRSGCSPGAETTSPVQQRGREHDKRVSPSRALDSPQCSSFPAYYNYCLVHSLDLSGPLNLSGDPRLWRRSQVRRWCDYMSQKLDLWPALHPANFDFPGSTLCELDAKTLERLAPHCWRVLAMDIDARLESYLSPREK